jgi:lipopolysaccharide export system protein LptA
LIRLLSKILLCGVLALTACSKRERSKADDSEWADIQPLTEELVEVAVSEKPIAPSSPEIETLLVQPAPQENYSPLVERLAAMQKIGRASGEVLITGESLTFDYERRFVRMDQEVKVVDDRGELETETLMGRFSADNKIEMIEVSDGVKINSDGRKAVAENGTYVFSSGAIELAGNPQLTEGLNVLSGDRIKFWINGQQRMVCEPNARLLIPSVSASENGVVSAAGDRTEIRSDRLVYDKDLALAEFDGNVHVRDPKAALDSDKVLLHLKENTQIDWIEAHSEVIIQTQNRKALADRASYYAEDKKFVLDGNPKVQEGRNIMTGDRITFWQESGRVVCEPNARILFHPDEGLRSKFLKDLKE